ncbi:tetratricopeptide repeat protein [Schlesneria paludicola]|uniref:tetratricopeptide repeat protein n=1 Tax=Schlesneria paludicola TaxID=360056 RepID=UPI0003057FD8|nr:tetratricopeptide repeat protein [Schlesneria paludicola]
MSLWTFGGNDEVGPSGLRNAFLLLGLVFVAYLPVLSAGYIWDDDFYLTNNVHLRSGRGLWQIWFSPRSTPQYYPMVFTSYWLEYRLWRLHPVGFHFDNVLLHGINAILLSRILTTLRVPGAFWAAVIFAIHPVHVESVAWITERKNVLSGLFSLLAFQAYWRFAVSDGQVKATTRTAWYSLSLLTYACALLSKSVTCSLPAVIVLVLWWKQERLSWRLVAPLAPMFVLGLAAGLNTASLEAHHVGAKGIEWNWTAWERCLIAARIVWFYAGKLIWPWPLIFIYPKWQIRSDNWWMCGALVAAVLLLVALWWGARRWGRGPFTACLIYGGTLFPALGFINVYPMRYSFVADHFQYLASIGLIALVVASVASFIKQNGVFSVLVTWGTATLLLVMVGTTFLRCFDYRDRESLWTATVADNPNCWMAQYHLAAVRFDQQRYLEAADLFQRALQHSPKDGPDTESLAELHGYLADCYLAMQQTAAAQEQFLAALKHFEQQLARPNADRSELYNNLGVIHGKMGQLIQSRDAFERAVELEPNRVEINQNLGELQFRLKRFDESTARFERVLQLDPQNIRAHYNLAVLSMTRGDRSRARQHLDAALRVQPEFVAAQQLRRQLDAK